MPYFSDVDEIVAWVSGLVRLQVAPADIRLMVPRNADEEFLFAATAAVREQEIDQQQTHQPYRSVIARSGNAFREPGIGVSVMRPRAARAQRRRSPGGRTALP